MRAPLSLVALLALAGCASSPRGETYGQYMQERDAQLSGAAQPSAGLYGPDVQAIPLDGTPPVATYSAAPITPGQNYVASSQGAVNAEPARAAVFSGISDEQSFDAVSSRETIQSDAARIERNRSQYQVIAPTALPQRRRAGGPNIVEYALQTNNPVGQPLHSRVNPLRGSMNARNCAKYASPDLAQQAFLESGGPERDSRSLDPDGDGYACAWDPAPFRKVLN